MFFVCIPATQRFNFWNFQRDVRPTLHLRACKVNLLTKLSLGRSRPPLTSLRVHQAETEGWIKPLSSAQCQVLNFKKGVPLATVAFCLWWGQCG